VPGQGQYDLASVAANVRVHAEQYGEGVLQGSEIAGRRVDTSTATVTGMDVIGWIGNDLRSLSGRLTTSVIGVVPHEFWHDPIDNGGSSLTHLLLHLARHHDLAVATAIRNHPPLFAAHREALGLSAAPPSAGLPEREDATITKEIPAEALITYLDEVFNATAAWLDNVASMALDTIPDSDKRLTRHADLSVDDVGWLHRMWADKPVWWLVQWPVVGHGNAHTGEAIALRNRLGLSPF
jgi:hypothetical protein